MVGLCTASTLGKFEIIKMKWQGYIFTITIITIFLVSFLSLNVGFVSAQTIGSSCSVIGQESAGASLICNTTGAWDDLKENGEQCLNDFECKQKSCQEFRCQDKEIGVPGSIDDIDLRGGFLCQQLDIFCPPPPPCEDGDCPPPGGRIEIIIDSPRPIVYDKKVIPLRVRDKNNNARTWRYSLNGGDEKIFVPPSTITAKEGVNTLTVIALKSKFAREKYTASVAFTVNTKTVVEPYCGDNICSESRGETEATCPQDCIPPPPLDPCGDNFCDAEIDEDYNTCPEDCEKPKLNPLFIWFIIGLIVLALIILILIIFLIRKKDKKPILANNTRRPMNNTMITKPIAPTPIPILPSKLIPKGPIPKLTKQPIIPLKKKITVIARTPRTKTKKIPIKKSSTSVKKKKATVVKSKTAKSNKKPTKKKKGNYIYKGKKYYPR
jgi:hypothetical protein